MSEEITPETFSHLVQLAELELTSDEAELLRNQLNNQLKAINEMRSISIPEELQPTSHGVLYSLEITPKTRMDEWSPYLDTQDLLDQAPEIEDNYIVVPDIPHTSLG